MLSAASINGLGPVGASVSVLVHFLCSPFRLSHRGRLALAQHHHPPDRDRFRSNGKYTGLIVGISIGIILLLFLAFVFYARIVSCRREVSRERAGRARTDEEFIITPFAAPSPMLAVAPPPYENPPSFEDAVKRPEMTSPSLPREGQDGRDGVAS
jgi:hypothetical protein